MTTNVYLEQIWWLDELIWSKMEEIKELENVTYGISAMPIREKVQSSVKKDMTGNIAIELTAKREEILQSINKCVNEKGRIKNQIDSIKDINAHRAMVLKYVKKLNTKSIMKKMDRSKSQIMRFLKNGLLEFEEQFGKEYLDKCS